MKKLIYLLLPLWACFSIGCNTSIEKAVSKPNNVKAEERGLNVPLQTFITPDIFKGKDQEGYTPAFKDNVYSSAAGLMSADIALNSNNSMRNHNFNGLIKCSVSYSKNKTRMWGVVLIVPTCGLCPLGHINFERMYNFEIYDAMGKRVTSFSIKGKKNNVMNILSSFNYDGTEVMTLKNALKEFYKQSAKHANAINARLATASKELNDKINGGVTERDITMAEWLDSDEELPIEVINQALEDAPEDYVGWGLRIQHFMNRKKYNDALSDIQMYCYLNPACQIIKPYYLKADVLYRLGRKNEALEALQFAKAYHPSKSDIQIFEGMIYSEMGMVSSAIKSFENAVKINPDDEESIKILGELRERKGELEEMRNQEQIEEWNRKSAAMNMMANALNNTAQSLSTLSSNSGKTNTQNYQNTNIESGNSSRVKTKDCSLCDGKGWIVGNSTASFAGGSKYCDECKKTVHESHSHDQCPACRGTGKVTTIR
ncbi:MAG: tetratricopeptide repeat protein [Clostridium sp.]|nr:tetratricopeptide repeat protein [Clostridium sp.]